MPVYKYFSAQESQGLSNELMVKLDQAREVAGIPFIITSGLRTCAANAAAMGVEHSAHIQGLAVDLGLGHLAQGYDRDHARYLMMNALLSAGFNRFGIYSGHIHVDCGKSPDYIEGICWYSTAT